MNLPPEIIIYISKLCDAYTRFNIEIYILKNVTSLKKYNPIFSQNKYHSIKLLESIKFLEISQIKNKLSILDDSSNTSIDNINDIYSSFQLDNNFISNITILSLENVKIDTIYLTDKIHSLICDIKTSFNTLNLPKKHNLRYIKCNVSSIGLFDQIYDIPNLDVCYCYGNSIFKRNNKIRKITINKYHDSLLDIFKKYSVYKIEFSRLDIKTQFLLKDYGFNIKNLEINSYEDFFLNLEELNYEDELMAICGRTNIEKLTLSGFNCKCLLDFSKLSKLKSLTVLHMEYYGKILINPNLKKLKIKGISVPYENYNSELQFIHKINFEYISYLHISDRDIRSNTIYVPKNIRSFIMCNTNHKNLILPLKMEYLEINNVNIINRVDSIKKCVLGFDEVIFEYPVSIENLDIKSTKHLNPNIYAFNITISINPYSDNFDRIQLYNSVNVLYLLKDSYGFKTSKYYVRSITGGKINILKLDKNIQISDNIKDSVKLILYDY